MGCNSSFPTYGESIIIFDSVKNFKFIGISEKWQKQLELSIIYFFNNSLKLNKNIKYFYYKREEHNSLYEYNYYFIINMFGYRHYVWINNVSNIKIKKPKIEISGIKSFKI